MSAAGRFWVAVVGPTGSGKSVLALDLAERFRGEIVSCDALQVYRGVDVGTGKLPPEARRGIPHHLLDLASPHEEFSAARYLELAAARILEIQKRGTLPLVVGGTGLYFRALARGLFDGPGRSPEIRKRLEEAARREGPDFLRRMLSRLDRASEKRIHPNDRVRTIRAIEVALLSGRRMSELMAERRSPVGEQARIAVGLCPPRAELARRIAARVEEMFSGGFIEEVARLRESHGREVPAFKAIGYREVSRHLSGEVSRREAMELTRKATLRYAKRQMTWFRREEVTWFAGSGDDPRTRAAVRRHLERLLPLEPSGEEILHAKTAS